MSAVAAGSPPPHAPARWRRIAVAAVLVAAAGLLAAALLTGVATLRFAAGADEADGRVVAVDARQSGGSASEVAYFPVVEFRPAGAERPIRFAGDGSGAREYRVGDPARVLYRADDPDDARIGGAASLWSTPAAFTFAAMLTLGTGVLLRRVLLEEQPGGPDDHEA